MLLIFICCFIILFWVKNLVDVHFVDIDTREFVGVRIETMLSAIVYPCGYSMRLGGITQALLCKFLAALFLLVSGTFLAKVGIECD